MKILAFETSCEHATVALLLDGQVMEFALEGHTNHSERLLTGVREFLAQAQLALNQLDALAFGCGPGAFTGLRLACAVAQGLAMGADLGLVPVPSLAALSVQARGAQVFAATDARMGEVYSAAYRMIEGLPVAVGETTCTPPRELALPPDGLWYVIGSAAKAHPDELREQLGARVCGWNPDAVPRAGDVAKIAVREIGDGRILAPELAGPVYVRDKVALTTNERMARGGRA